MSGRDNVSRPLAAALRGAGVAFALCCAGVLALAFAPGDCSLVGASTLIGTALGVGGTTLAAYAAARATSTSESAR